MRGIRYTLSCLAPLMRTPFWLCAVTGLVCAPAQAALSGYYDSVEQIQVVLQDMRVIDALKQMPIESIERQRDQADDTTRHWRIRSRDCELHVLLESRPPPGVGKTTYLVKHIDGCR
ncbi:hypothetical protein [Pseudomonas huaxiensis]|uniref:hypothetical protein n=1 Tax=Pseudomonas huaxiensis TaxID=2213017 RepID=UPI001300A91E|nr:hypothetical protein [Pseudomonas huaxiensis]